MQLSRFLKIYPAEDYPGHHIYFSTRRASMALVPDEIHQLLVAGDVGQVPADQVESLAGLDMLVKDHETEWQEVDSFLAEVNHYSTTLRIAVILGLTCNFACTYCYEGELKGASRMSWQVADQMVAFIKNRMSSATLEVVLDFYGGEPLLYADLIKRIAGDLKTSVEEQGASFRFTLVSNGSLLDGSMVNDLKPFGLDGAKVTVDGPAENHNRYRPFKSGKPSFDAIVANLKEVSGLTRIGLQGNYDRENFCSFANFLGELTDLGLGPDRLDQVTFHPVMRISDSVVGLEFGGGCATMNEPWLAEASPFLMEEIRKRGFKTPNIGPATCMMDLEKAFTVHFDGTIYKCPGLIGHEDFAVGDIWSGIKDYRESHHLDNWRVAPECQHCAYLPLCFGGCRFMQYQRTGSMAGVDCQKDFLDRTLHTLLLQQIRYPTNKGSEE